TFYLELPGCHGICRLDPGFGVGEGFGMADLLLYILTVYQTNRRHRDQRQPSGDALSVTHNWRTSESVLSSPFIGPIRRKFRCKEDARVPVKSPKPRIIKDVGPQ